MPLFDELANGAGFEEARKGLTADALRQLWAEGCGAFVGRQQCRMPIVGYVTGSPVLRWQTYTGAWWGGEATVETAYSVRLCLDHGVGNDGRIHQELLTRDLDTDLLMVQMAEAYLWFLSQGRHLDLTP